MNQLAELCDLSPNSTFNAICKEMEKRFYNSVLLVDFGTGDGPKLVRYTGIGGDAFHFRDDYTGKKCIIEVNDTRAVVSVPDFPCGYYSIQYQDIPSLYYFQRQPHRQWKRGLSQENSELVLVTDMIFGKMFKSNQLIPSYPALSCTKSYTLDEACALASKYGESIVNLDFAITANPVKDDDVLYLWYHCCVVGTISPKEYKIIVENPVLVQEVKDAFYNTQYKVEVAHES